MRIIDISGWIHNGMWQTCPEYPGAEITELPKPASVRADYDIICQRFVLSGQSGTYIETRAHIDRAAQPVADVPLEELFFDCSLILLPDLPPRAAITAKMLATHAPDLSDGNAILVGTDWDRRWRKPEFATEGPYLTKEAGHWLLDRRPALLGADLVRIDNIRAPEFPWKRFFDECRFLLGPVVNLRAARGKRLKLQAFPLKIEGAAATPCRAVLFEDFPSNRRNPKRRMP
ncbi:MAG: cyclase family protein [Verrucomicrobia bacterium]|nr:cyclase family protein [Verrucomicrobiota bacterium]